MSTTWKVIIGVALAAALIFLGITIGRGQSEDPQVKEISLSVHIKAPGSYTLEISPKNADGQAEVAVTKGQPVVFTVTTAPVGGFDLPVLLKVFGPGEGAVTYTGNPIPVGGGTATITIDTAGLTSNAGYAWTLRASPGISEQGPPAPEGGK